MDSEREDLISFVESVCDEVPLRIEADLGHGFVRLRSSEAERRQAAQDIRCSEDIVLELLRNSRDAGAHRIYLALSRDEDTRRIFVLDDGEGIPSSMHKSIFEPRVTSKLDSFHKDKWGVHGRGMALYSIAVNSEHANVVSSAPGLGSVLEVQTNLKKLPEKADQSSFPHFLLQEDGSYAMRGPKNILRTAADFALEHRELCQVYCGSLTEVLSTLYYHGLDLPLTSKNITDEESAEVPLIYHLSYAADPLDFTKMAHDLGIDISERSARRIMDGTREVLKPLLQRLKEESFTQSPSLSSAQDISAEEVSRGESLDKGTRHSSQRTTSRHDKVKFSAEDLDDFRASVGKAYKELADAYYLNDAIEPSIQTRPDSIHIVIPIERQE